MSSVDDRVVQLKFDNAAFEAGVKTTLDSMDKLKKSMQFDASSKSLTDLQKNASNFNMGNMHTVVDGVSTKFLALATIGINALSKIADKAIAVGISLVKSLTVDPIKAGLDEYATNLNAIQTILANTQASGSTLKDVNAALNELNTYSDKTIYNFTEMARNIGTFTAAGVDLKTSTASIKGIANLAALSGSNSQQASTAMYQLSQAISAGQVKLQDWNSVVNAGMGGTVFQRALAQTAEQMGTIQKGALKLTGSMKNVTISGESFRQSLTPKGGGESWLTKDVLTKTLQQFTGDLSDAQLAAQGYSKAQIQAIQLQAKTAQEAATKVKTLSQTLDVAKETAGSGWTTTWQIIFGDFEQARTTFTELSNSINGVINNMSNARNALLKGWAALGGRNVAIDAIKDAFKALMSVLNPIRAAFKEIFPPTTAKQLYAMTVNIRNFFVAVKMGPKQMDALKRTFAGIFAVLDIGVQIITAVVKTLGKLIFTAGKSSGGFLDLTAKIGDFLVSIDKFLKRTGVIEKFFNGLGNILRIPIVLLGAIGDALSAVFTKNNPAIEAGGAALGKIPERLAPLARLMTGLQTLFSSFSKSFGTMSPAIDKIFNHIVDVFNNLAGAIGDAIKNGNYKAILDIINTSLFGGLVLLFHQFLSKGLKINVGGSFFDKINAMFSQLTSTLKAMEKEIQAKTLMEIAIAVALLAASVVALSLIDSKKLTIALSGLTVIFTELFSALWVLNKISGSASTFKLPVLAAGLVILSTAILILVASVKILSTMSWGELTRGLLALAVILGLLVATVEPLSAQAGAMIRASIGLVAIGVALNILAIALKILSTMNWQSLAKGMVAVTALLGLVGEAMRLMPKNMIMSSLGLLAIASSLGILAATMKIFASMSWEEIGKGLAGVAGSLAGIGLAMRLMPKNMIVQSTGLILVAGALALIALVMKNLGSMSWESVAKGLVALAGAMGIIAAGLILMEEALPGAAALIVAAGALLILSKVLAILGAMSWSQLLMGLGALAGMFIVLGVAGLVLEPVIPAILGLGAAIALLGIGLGLIGIGVLAFVTAITLLISIANLGVIALNKLIDNLVAIIPHAAAALVVALAAFANSIKEAAPTIIGALVTLLSTLLDGLVKLIPKVMVLLELLLDSIIKLIVKYVPKLVIAGTTIILGILTGLQRNLPQIVKRAGDLIIAFVKAIGANGYRVISAAGDTLILFLNQMTTWINTHSAELGKAGGDLMAAIIKGMVSGVSAGAGAVTGAMKDMAGNAIGSAMKFLHINSPSKDFIKIGQSVTEGFVKGVVGSKAAVVKSMNTITASIAVAVKDSAAQMKTLQAQLKAEQAKPKTSANKKAIAATTAALKAATAAHTAAIKAQTLMSTGLKKQETQLIALGAQYDAVTAKLTTAKQALADAIKTRDDFAASTAEQYNKLPDITEETSLDTYFDQIRDATAANNKFIATLHALREIGLDDTSYQKFLEQGTDAQPFLDALLDSGASTVAELNNIDKTLANSATSLGKTAGSDLYQAGVNMAQGLVNGLNAQMASISKQMTAIGTSMANAIKKALGIKSPSKVFEEIGKFANQGLAQGLEKYAKVVEISAASVGDSAINGLKDTMSGISDVLGSDVDMNPVIAPVLDLDAFRKEATKMSDILAPGAITPTSSAVNATTIASAQKALLDQLAESQTALAATGTTLEFNQYNTSPKSLTPAEIYRQTKNQLSIVKGALNANNPN